MSTLLVQSCSKSKISPSEPVKAIDLYSGYFYKILKKSIRAGEFNDKIDISILSAKYGLISPERTIEPYDRQMTISRADQLADEVTTSLQSKIEEQDYEQVVINAGKAYRCSVITEQIPTEVRYIAGDGIGTKGHAFKQFIRGDRSVLKEEP
jgi:cytoplasmic iron level regulating protein YaaA (DUF328/UPF0246 family)